MVIDDCQLPAMRSWAFLDHTDHTARNQLDTGKSLGLLSYIGLTLDMADQLSVLMSKSD